MIREIEFRGKSKLNKEWLFGDLLRLGGNRTPCIFSDKDSIRYFNTDNSVVIPETIGQLWATKDNTKFYEGDIISFGISGRLICVLIYNEINKCFSFIEKSEYNKLQTADELLRSNILSNLSYAKVEMIKALLGNIHDNPELLNS